MLSAQCTQILPRRRPEVNRKSATIDAFTRRAQARMAAVYDTRLSDGATRLYMILDDDSGKRGTTWTAQGTLAARLRISDRQIRRYLAELEGAGHVTRQRGQYGAEFRLSWAGSDRTNLSASPDARSDRAVQIDASPLYIPEPMEPEPACSICRDSGWHNKALCQCAEGRAIWRRMNTR